LILYSKPGLQGVEIWHGIARRAPLYQLRNDKRAYFAGLRQFLEDLQDGRACVEDDEDLRALECASGFDEVLFCGGEAAHPSLTDAMNAAPFDWSLGPSGAFAAREGAMTICAELGWLSFVALDLGQTQLKVMARSYAEVMPRPDTLPFGARSLPAEAGRVHLRAFLREALRPFPDVDGVLLGLPNAITPFFEARSATYPGLFGPIEPIFDELFSCEWAVVNDAVMAARGFEPAPGRKRLVVTLGFGVGGAVWYHPVQCTP
jgi:hypothetical protein